MRTVNSFILILDIRYIRDKQAKSHTRKLGRGYER